MEDSTRFLSLSGLSGIFAGVIALIGATFAYFILLNNANIPEMDYFNSYSLYETRILRVKLIIDLLLVLILAIAFSYYFSSKKARRDKKKIWTYASRRMLINLVVPLATGGFFIFILIIHDQIQLIIPSMLVFYGLALVNAGKFTYNEVFYLGLSEIITGILAGFIQGSGIFLWAFGFGILHIGYGIFMFRKYDR